jgi:hypothetical protein
MRRQPGARAGGPERQRGGARGGEPDAGGDLRRRGGDGVPHRQRHRTGEAFPPRRGRSSESQSATIVQGDPSGPTFALGFRGFTTGVKHRGFLALCVSQLFVESGFTKDPSRLYGPGVEAGYQFASRGGFTVMVGLGLGYAPGMPEGESEVASMIELGLGYTWRR